MIKKYQYIKWLQSRALQPRTIEQYTLALENMASICDRFDQRNVDKFVGEYKGNVVRSFIRSYKTYLLRSAIVIGINQDQVNKIRAIDIPSIKVRERKVPEVLTKEEVLQIYRKMPTPETKLILLLSFFCGLRRQTALDLKAGMFNIEKWSENPESMGILRVVSKGNKTGIIPVTSKVMHKVYEYLPEDYDEETKLFNINPRVWNNKLSKGGREALGRHVNPHLLRHSMAMHLRGQGFHLDMIKEFLMHESIDTTQIYAHTTPEQLIEKFKDIN